MPTEQLSDREWAERIAAKLEAKSRVLAARFTEPDKKVLARELREYRKAVLREARDAALDERVNAEETGDEGDRAYNQACEDVATRLERLAEEEQGG